MTDLIRVPRDGKDLGSGPDGELTSVKSNSLMKVSTGVLLMSLIISSEQTEVLAALVSLVLVLVLVGLERGRKQRGPTLSPAPDDVTYCDVTNHQLIQMLCIHQSEQQSEDSAALIVSTDASIGFYWTLSVLHECVFSSSLFSAVFMSQL
ncbi:hemicentin-2-like isoform X1 [Lates japonicus]|uniref:Hemicentin-2-like isoform X1 n=1 Tax=Lates japonicus TaxID=270547 RepID=A0AAD3M5P6_LATJO|nr:hemicentin-2-like isoform X1 [Lates japonicus]